MIHNLMEVKMSWKLFGQIALLMVIGIVLLMSAKCLKYKICKKAYCKTAVEACQKTQNFGVK